MPIENGMDDPNIPEPIRMALEIYSTKLHATVHTRIHRFAESLAMELTMGWREPMDSDGPVLLTAENLARRTDKCGHPMFEGEILDWVKTIRFILNYPADLVGDTEVYDAPLRDQLIYEEFMVFCLWLEGETRGAGKTLLAGPLRVSQK